MTGWIPDVVPDQLIESAWGNQIRDRTATPFANAAARDTAITAPKAGMVCWLQDAQSLCVYNGTAWVNLSRGRIAYAATAGQDRTQGLAILVQVNFTLPTARLVRVDGFANWQEITAASNASQYVNIGTDLGRQIQVAPIANLGLSQSQAGYGALFVQLAAGAHTAEIHAANNSTVGAMRFAAGLAGGWIAVTDFG